jgi:hypothetical protein
MVTPSVVSFIAGAAGAWRVERMLACRGEGLVPAARLDVTGPRGGLVRLRDTEEWCYVDREIDIRLIRAE